MSTICLANNVLKVKYNTGQPDQFFHKYAYDADNRITSACTSADGVVWEKECFYQYYLHGPLKRTTLGEDQVQGLDYAYTVHGWLKGINNPYDIDNVSYNTANDPGGEALPEKSAPRMPSGWRCCIIRATTSITGHPLDVTTGSGVLLPLAGRDLYNETLRAGPATCATRPRSAQALSIRESQANCFTYDQLNRIKSHNFRYMNAGVYTVTNDYSEVTSTMPTAI